ncbi:MAG: glycosyltransferase family 39 protein, partial [Thermodesulfobacteriota bacterium]|nr:glycosyltransferase family 39 protein [Thermodesulfobacteriota bacterium]
MNKVLSGIIIVAIVALTTRILLFSGILMRNPGGFFQVDSYGYWQIAENIINHNSFSSSNNMPLMPNHSRTPLYPLFISSLSWFGLNAPGIIFIQILLSSVTCILVIFLTYALTGNWKPAFLAGGIIAVDIPSVVLSNCLLTETLFTFLLTFSILFLVFNLKAQKKSLTLCYSGILMGFSILCRPIAVFLPIFVIILLLLFSRTTKLYLFNRIFLYLFFCFLTVSPWLVRNQVVFGSPFLSTIGYKSLLYYRAAGVYSMKEGISISKSQEILRKKARSAFQGNIKHEPIEYMKFEAKIASSIIMENPLIYIRNHILSVFNMLFKPMRSTIDLQMG